MPGTASRLRRRLALLYRVVYTAWGLALLLGLAGVSFYQAAYDTDEAPPPPTPSAAQAGDAAIQASAAGHTRVPRKTTNPVLASHPSMVIHLACAEEDAYQARIYDPPPAGVRHIILRIDQSPDEIEALVEGTDTVYPDDAIVAVTACFQDAYVNGEFP